MAFVAVDDDGTVLGTVETGPNKGGGGPHIPSGGFMVDPAHHGKGVGRALWKSLGFAVIVTVPYGYRRPTGEYVGPPHHVQTARRNRTDVGERPRRHPSSVIEELTNQLTPYASAIHAYYVTATLTYVKNGRILPPNEE